MTTATTNTPASSFGQRFLLFWFVAGIPLSLSSPGATVAMGMVAACGLVAWYRGAPMPDDLRAIGKIAVLAWALLTVVDVVNGGSTWDNLKTVVDYLPVLVIAPLALGYRLTGVSPATVDRILMATVGIATVSSLIQWIGFDVFRPGGLNLNPIPFAFVVLLWGTFLFARGLAELEGRAASAAIVGAVAALIPILLSGSRAVWICTAVAYGLVGLRWAVARRSFRALSILLAGAAVIVAASSFSPLVQDRVSRLVTETQAIAEVGATGANGSVGRRVAMIRAGWLAFAERPVLGNGLAESMQMTILHSSPDGPNLAIHSHIHNDYVAHLAAYGVFGLAFLAIYFWLLLRMAAVSRLASYRWAGQAIAAALAIYMVADIGFNMDPMTGAMALVAGLLLCFPRAEAT